MAVKAICVKKTYTASTLWKPGDIRVFGSKAEVKKAACFRFMSEITEEAEDTPQGEDLRKKPFSQLTMDEYRALAKKEEIDIPESCDTRNKIRDYVKVQLEEKAAATIDPADPPVAAGDQAELIK